MFIRPNQITNQFYEVDLEEPENEHKEPIFVRFFNL